MADYQISSKLSANRQGYAISSGSVIFFWLNTIGEGFCFMTATAPEDDRGWKVYDNQSNLMSTTQRVLSDHDIVSVVKRDLQGRLFVEAAMILSEQDIDHVVPAILLAIGVDGDIAVDALQDILAVYDEFAVDDIGDDVYLGDGTWVTQDGRIRTK